MKLMLRPVAVLPVLLMAACASKAPPRQADTAPTSKAASGATNVTPAVPVAPAAPEAAPAPSAEEIKRLQAQQKREMDDEAQRLAVYQKNLFQVFRLNETLAGFKPRSKAVGVYELAASKSGKLRLALAQLPNSPARLAVGSYVVNLDFEIGYTEKQECVAGACAGTTEQVERTASRSVQVILTPKNNFAASTTLPLADAKAAGAGGNHRSSYSNLVLTVRRMTATVAKAQD